MKHKYLRAIGILFVALCCSKRSAAQGMHFSQYYNAPLLLNPANTALMPDNDYQLGLNYRQQWATIPAPYSTFSAYGNFQVMRNKNEANWMGLGLAIFNDRAGDGKLSLFQMEALIAYHVQLNQVSMISAGGSVSTVQRSVNFNNLSFDRQWNGLYFDKELLSEEDRGLEKTSYISVNAGINYAYFPGDYLYMKVGVGVANINKPVESFYNAQNTIEYRPMGNIDITFRSTDNLIINPSAYYSSQSSASEIVYGSLFCINLTNKTINENTSNQLILGAFHRWNDAIIGVAGVQLNGVRIMASYDHTVSRLAPSNNGIGAFEISLRYEGVYGENSKTRSSYHCPRF